jgi:hypothetical protein
MAIAPRGFLHLWVQQALPGALAQAFASQMAPGDPSGDAGPTRTTILRATSTYFLSPVDQAMVEQALQGRVTSPLATSLYWLARRWRR